MSEERAIVLSDAHYPDVSPKAMSAALDFAKKLRPQTILIAGDWLDILALGRWAKPPGQVLVDEIRTGIAALEDLRHKFPNAEIKWMFSNHCNRFDKYLVEKAPELWGALSLEVLCKTDDLGIIVVKDWLKDIWIDWHGLLIGHPVKGLSNTAGMTAMNHLKRKGRDLLIGHTHRQAMVSLRIGGRTVYGYENGCLCDMDPTWDDDPNWAAGFSWLEYADGKTNVNLVRL